MIFLKWSYINRVIWIQNISLPQMLTFLTLVTELAANLSFTFLYFADVLLAGSSLN